MNFVWYSLGIVTVVPAAPHPGSQMKVRGGICRRNPQIFVVAVVALDPALVARIAPPPVVVVTVVGAEVDAPAPDGEVAPVKVHPEGRLATTASGIILLSPEGVPKGSLPLDAPVPVQAERRGVVLNAGVANDGIVRGEGSGTVPPLPQQRHRPPPLLLYVHARFLAGQS